ncbi:MULTISPECIES: precorrin-2 C(20)-methyltransferase [Commensalibacter]|uniref:Precorrin-2 C(20)-methyltransferase n=2 Tax=Commensalibacter TaxID=1079922 RepID=W7E3K6_9PROT|nr:MULTISPECIES: precorrin-2 C(20)-methyltransferase [Commensalibacter]EUK17636.1 precorrin-2 C(20)-methyltransferase [Commensalibacter papalotli (ex Servin-Garciduenas et al. 2014)]CAI3953500.1 Precorrin-2 methylase (CobF) (PDB:2QBU) [Commensalibacter papalotli (ex Botero et al. 2024)]CAI3954007.1 Precorrin-2 methylase (CobF) (PDB:2QBU) [Commensalibacter papalotli (ex Botero et al. 2024)]
MSGHLYILGMGPGDPELVTRKAERILRYISFYAYFAKKGEVGHARKIADDMIVSTQQELRFEYPITTEIPHKTNEYKQALSLFYDECADIIEQHLKNNQDVALLCEGDPLFYGSAMYILERLQPSYSTHIVPGISAMSGCWSNAQLPIVKYEQTLTVLPATLSSEELVTKLCYCNAVVIMKIGRNLSKVKQALQEANMYDKAIYIERGTQVQEKIMPLSEFTGIAPYFSLILIAG